jgi:hypothetical protein
MTFNLSYKAGRVQARVQRTAEGLWTSVNIIDKDGTLVETDLRLFAYDRDVNDWLQYEATRRGFSRTAVEFVE